MHRWWHTKQLADNRIIMGKPSVLFRKVVNTRIGDENHRRERAAVCRPGHGRAKFAQGK